MHFPEKEIKAFLDAAPDAIVVVDAQGSIAFVNAETEAMFGYPRDELIGHPVEVLLPERYRDRHVSHQHAYFAEPRRRPMGAGLELHARRHDGTEFPVEISLSPVQVDQKKFACGAIRDVSAHKAIEHALIEARESAEHANRAKSGLLAAVSHDLRQPLQTLTLLNSVLSRTVPAGTKAGAVVGDQCEALRLMSDVLNALLDISKLDAGAIEPAITNCVVGSIFARLRAEFAPLAEAKGLELIVEDCEEVVRTDPTLLGLIVQNLLANAIRYTCEGFVRLRARLSGETLWIEVTDTGVGVPDAELKRIFEEFYQTPRAPGEGREGLGLGLSIVQRMAELLDCALDVRSTVGRGSSFAIEVPRALGAGDSMQRRAPAEPAAVQLCGALVVVVDDDAAVADATAMLLSSTGLDVVVAGNSEQAASELRAYDKPPSLLICDYHLDRGETGLEAVRALRRAACNRIPAILISGDTSSAILEAKANVEDYRVLRKPVDADTMLALVRSLLPS